MEFGQYTSCSGQAAPHGDDLRQTTTRIVPPPAGYTFTVVGESIFILPPLFHARAPPCPRRVSHSFHAESAALVTVPVAFFQTPTTRSDSPGIRYGLLHRSSMRSRRELPMYRLDRKGQEIERPGSEARLLYHHRCSCVWRVFMGVSWTTSCGVVSNHMN